MMRECRKACGIGAAAQEERDRDVRNQVPLHGLEQQRAKLLVELGSRQSLAGIAIAAQVPVRAQTPGAILPDARMSGRQDRKSTRLNSSHVEISYAVFCLKKKKKKRHNIN